MAVEVPDYVADAARRGLDWHAEGKSGDGVTDKTLREAREMADGSVSEDKLRRMGPWFQRHRPDMDAPKNKPDNKDFPGAGAVAWALWGGPTSGDIMRTADWVEAKVAQLDREQSASALSSPKTLTLTELPDMPRIFTDIDDTILKDGQPVEKVVKFIDETAEEVVVLTNRPESDREKTVADLEAIGFEYDGLIMNDSGDEAPAFKAKVIKAELDAGRPVDLFIDNRPDTREAVAALGVEVMAPEDVPEVVEEEEEVEDEVEEEVAPSAKVANFRRTSMTIEEQLVQAAASLAGLTAERDDLRATVEKLTVGATSEAEALKVEAAAKDAKLAELTSALEASAKEASELKAKVAELEAGKASASKEAAKIVASFGTEPVELPKGDSPAKMSNADIKAAYLALPAGPARIAFFNAHKAALISL
jgi:ribonucleotide monophosphatase NagD (HAD superfamily)